MVPTGLPHLINSNEMLLLEAPKKLTTKFRSSNLKRKKQQLYAISYCKFKE